LNARDEEKAERGMKRKIFDRITDPPSPSLDRDGIGRRDVRDFLKPWPITIMC